MAKLRFYYSAMNAGKSTMLLQAAFNYQERGMETITFLPEIVADVMDKEIKSRIGLSKKAISFDKDFDFLSHIKQILDKDGEGKIRCALIDEAQFLTKSQVQSLTRVVDQLGLPVLAYGLRTDFLGEPFEGSKYLMAWADDIIELRTICKCGSKAIMNLRIDAAGAAVNQGKQIEIGGNEKYISLCRKHFLEESKLSFSG